MEKRDEVEASAGEEGESNRDPYFAIRHAPFAIRKNRKPLAISN
jgi:hypothetical protein